MQMMKILGNFFHFSFLLFFIFSLLARDDDSVSNFRNCYGKQLLLRIPENFYYCEFFKVACRGYRN